MTDKLKKQARELAVRMGISYQAAHNLLTRKHTGASPDSLFDPPPAANSATREDRELAEARALMEKGDFSKMIAWARKAWENRPHEPDCPLSSWDRSLPKPECECLGLDHSLPLLDGDDYYD